jgi:hypothetical protein
MERRLLSSSELAARKPFGDRVQEQSGQLNFAVFGANIRNSCVAVSDVGV